MAAQEATRARVSPGYCQAVQISNSAVPAAATRNRDWSRRDGALGVRKKGRVTAIGFRYLVNPLGPALCPQASARQKKHRLQRGRTGLARCYRLRPVTPWASRDHHASRRARKVTAEKAADLPTRKSAAAAGLPQAVPPRGAPTEGEGPPLRDECGVQASWEWARGRQRQSLPDGRFKACLRVLVLWALGRVSSSRGPIRLTSDASPLDCSGTHHFEHGVAFSGDPQGAAICSCGNQRAENRCASLMLVRSAAT